MKDATKFLAISILLLCKRIYTLNKQNLNSQTISGIV